MNSIQQKEAVREVIVKLFMYTDQLNWKKLQQEVFAPKVLLDMSKAGGGEAATLTSGEICDMWQAGLSELDGVHHLSGNYLVDLTWDEARAFCYGIATHYKAGLAQGETRTFHGRYDFRLNHTPEGWRINSMTFILDFLTGNKGLA